MSTLARRVQNLIDMAEKAGWQVNRGAHYAKIQAPGRNQPVSLPGTPGSDRSVHNLEKLLERLGLNDAYGKVQEEREAERRQKVVQAQERAAKNITAAEKRAKAAQPSNVATLLDAGSASGMQVGFEIITPAMALELVTKSRAAEGFRQRKVSQSQVDDYSLLMKHGRWKQNVPDGVIGIDTSGVLVNGQHRMLALIDANVPQGFVVAREVPRDMFPFFDRAKTRTAADVFEIDGLPSSPSHQSTVRCAMRYYEMISGVREPSTWTNWNSTKDTNDEALNFYRRNPDLDDAVTTGRALGYGAKIIPAAGAVFVYYAARAWPDRPKDAEGYDPLDTFVDRVRTGEHMSRNAPAFVLREWSKDKDEKVRNKRETQLFLLFRHWALHAQGLTVPGARVQYQPGWPMPVPYNPKGDKAAVGAILKG